jgi:Ribbon-helix-helix protein, copG family
MRKPTQERLNVDVSDKLKERLRRASAMNEESIGAFVRRALREECDRLGIPPMSTPRARQRTAGERDRVAAA